MLGPGHVHARVDSDPGVNAVGEAARIVMAMNGMPMPDKAATVGHGASKVIMDLLAFSIIYAA